MKIKYFLLAAVAVGLWACQTPADYFDKLWLLNTKLSASAVSTLSATDAESYNKALDAVDGVLRELDPMEDYSPSDSVCFYVKKQGQFVSRLLHSRKDAVLDGGVELEETRKLYFDSASFFNDKINAVALEFMKKYDLNVAVQ